MSLESLKTGVFTHKSDVWSFGVTVWEIMTYGEEPYTVDTLRGLVNYLDSGKRLHQPEACSADIYTVLMNCWALDTQERPSSNTLGEEFSKMAKDPERFITVPGFSKIQRMPELPPHNFYFDIHAAEHSSASHRYTNVEL